MSGYDPMHSGVGSEIFCTGIKPGRVCLTVSVSNVAEAQMMDD